MTTTKDETTTRTAMGLAEKHTIAELASALEWKLLEAGKRAAAHDLMKLLEQHGLAKGGASLLDPNQPDPHRGPR